MCQEKGSRGGESSQLGLTPAAFAYPDGSCFALGEKELEARDIYSQTLSQASMSSSCQLISKSVDLPEYQKQKLKKKHIK